MLSQVKKYAGSAVYQWRNTGAPSVGSPKELDKKMDDAETYFRKTVNGKSDQDYCTAFTNWLSILNDAMLMSMKEKERKLNLRDMKGLDKKRKEKVKADLARLDKTANLTIPTTISDEGATATSLIAACKIIAQYLDVLIDAGVIDKDDCAPGESYTGCCVWGLYVARNRLQDTIHAQINATTKRTINGVLDDIDRIKQGDMFEWRDGEFLDMDGFSDEDE